jgi:diguanylate cyclase (GGDEF)-like protein
MKTQYLHRLLIVMIIATALALLLHRYGMDAVFRIDGNSNFIANAVDDRDSGGKTQSTLRRENGKLILECQVDTSYQWPYCEIAIGLKQPPAGMDLSRYDFVRLKIRYEGPEDQHQVRFFLRNFHPAYAKVGDATSLKVQELVYDPSTAKYPLDVELSRVTIASWWSNSRKIPIEHLGTDFTNISTIEVSTGGNVVAGFHRIVVEGIEFRGKLISSANFRLGIIAVWLLVMIGYLVADAVLTHRQLSASTRQQASLKRINEALRVQTLIYAKLSRHDTLTGVLNPKGLGDELFELAKQREEDIFPMSLVFVDIDHFRKINDQYSHSAGDQVLKNLSNVIRDHIKPSDLLARWGGEEFLVVCPGMSAAEAGDLAESLRNTVSSRIWPNGIRVTCSFGLSELAAGEDLGDGIKRASDALQRAKENGRDRVEAELAKVA